MMKTVTDWDIQAYLDNELTGSDQEAVLRALQHDAELRRRYNELRRQRELLKDWWVDH
jgi:anti-sigma factor RsiW